MEKIFGKIKGHLNFGENGIIIVVATVLAAFVASFGKLLNFPSAMNVAVAVVSGRNILPAFAGSLLAYAVMGDFSGGIVQLCSILVIAGVRFILPLDKLTLFGRKNEPVFLGLVTAGTLMLFGCVMSLAVESDTFMTSFRMINALMCGCTVFVAQTVLVCRNATGVFDLNGVNGIFVSILYIMIISTLSSVPLGVVNIGRAFGTFSMLMVVRKYRQTGGAVVGAITTCGVLLCTPTLARNTLLLATSGLVCGVFFQFGTLITLLVFLLTSLVSLVAMGVNSDTFPMFADMLIGSMMFIAVPLPAVKKLAKKFVGVRNSVDIVGQTTSSKLNFASRTISDIRGQLSMVTATIDRRTKDKKLSESVCNAVCGDCPERAVCFLKREQLMWSLGKLESVAAKYNCISADDVKKHLSSCGYPEYMSQAFNEIYSDMITEKADNIRLREMRELLTEQLSSMEDILSDLSFRVGQVRNIDPSLSAQVRDYFDILGYPNAKACVYIDENLCQRVEVYLTAEFKGDIVRLTAGLSGIIEYDLDLPVIVKADRLTKMSFAEVARFELELASFSASKSGEYSGDTFETFEQNGCEKYIILSDGMGTGKRARLDSVFSVSLVTRLIRSGMSMSTAHKMINSMLRVKGWEESFATLDIVKIDLFSANAQILKAGAAPTYLCRDGGIKVISCEAFPAGILTDCIPEITDFKLFDGDVIMVASDGVDDCAARELSKLSQTNLSVEAMCAKIGSLALDARSKEMQDDITVVIARINKAISQD